MGTSAAVAVPPSRSLLGHPLGITTLFFVEMWERMSFYGMRALLVLYLVDAGRGIGLEDRTAAAIYGLYNAGTYIVCLPGGWIADRLLGAQRAVILGGAIIATGHVLLGLAPSAAVFYLGLLVIVLGTGLLKPSVGVVVAALYPEGGARRDAGFTIYYMGVNLGAFIGPLVCGWLAQVYGWHAGFLAAAAGMTLGLGQFLWQRRLLGAAGRDPLPHERDAGGDVTVARSAPRRATLWLLAGLMALVVIVVLAWIGVVPLSAATLQSIAVDTIIAVAVLYFAYLLLGAGLDATERRRVGVVVVLFLASVLFWSGYEQAGSSFNLFAERYTHRMLLGWEVPASWFQSLNPIFIITLAPVFSALWLWLGRRTLDPSTPLKFVFGLAGMALGLLVMVGAARVVASGRLAGMGWLTITYLIHTLGELCLSPVGNSAVTKLVPQRFCGQALGVWFMSISLGNLFASRIAGDIDPTNIATMPAAYLRVFWLGSICAMALLLLTPVTRRWMGGVR
jgi:POT family proton-dependent oligopeptide transporter